MPAAYRRLENAIENGTQRRRHKCLYTCLYTCLCTCLHTSLYTPRFASARRMAVASGDERLPPRTPARCKKKYQTKKANKAGGGDINQTTLPCDMPPAGRYHGGRGGRLAGLSAPYANRDASADGPLAMEARRASHRSIGSRLRGWRKTVVHIRHYGMSVIAVGSRLRG